MMPCHYHNGLFPLALAIVCTTGTLQLENQASAADIQPPTIETKQAKKMAIAQVGPEYPAVAKVNYVEGEVRLELTIDDKGKVNRMHVVEGNAVLAESALRAARGWTYRPMATPSGPSGFITIVRVNFSLFHRSQELTPQQAERDFQRGVKLPQAVHPLEGPHPQNLIRMRLLVNDRGQVVDWAASPKSATELDNAVENLHRWTFRPAHWGNIPVASYLDVDIPLDESSVTRTAANSAGR